jgi:hypothetical protein
MGYAAWPMNQAAGQGHFVLEVNKPRRTIPSPAASNMVLSLSKRNMDGSYSLGLRLRGAIWNSLPRTLPTKSGEDTGRCTV